MATSSKKIQLSYPTISVSAPIFVKGDKSSMFSRNDKYVIRIGNSSLEFPTKKEADAIYNEIKNFKNEKQYLEFFQSYLLRRIPQRAYITSTFKETWDNFSEPKLGNYLTIENFYKVKRGTYFKFEHDNFGKKRMTEFVFDSTINDRVLGWMKIGDNWEYGDSLYNYENKICAFSGAEILTVKEMIAPPNKFELPNLNEAPKLSKKTEDDLYKLWDFVKNRKKRSDKLLEIEKQYEEIKPFLSKLTIDNVPTKIQALVLIDAKANRMKKVVSKEQVEKTIQNIWNDYYSGKDTFAYGGSMSKSYDYGGDFESPRIYIVSTKAYNNNIDDGVWLHFSDYENADELMNDIQNWLDEWGVEEFEIIDGEYLPAPMGMDVSDLRKANFEEIYMLMDVAKEKGISIDDAYEEVYGENDSFAKGGTLDWQKYPTKNVRGLYEIKGDGINRKVNIVFFERYDDEFYSLYPLDKDKHLFTEILVKSTALNSLDKGVLVQGETNDGKKVSIKRISNQDFSYAKGGGISDSVYFKPSILESEYPNFLTIIVKYPVGDGFLTALGQKTSSGQERDNGQIKASEISKSIVAKLNKEFNIEDIDVSDNKNGKIVIFAVSDDFVSLPKNTLEQKLKTNSYANGGDISERKRYTLGDLKNMGFKQFKGDKMYRYYFQKDGNNYEFKVIPSVGINSGFVSENETVLALVQKYAKGGGVGLIGNQKRIDLNKNGKIDAEDFEIMRSTMDGAWRNDHQHVNSTSRKDGKLQDYEVIYARKHKSDRTGYKGKTNFADGGGVGMTKSIGLLYNKTRRASKDSGDVVYLNSENINLDGYTNLKPYSVKASDDEIKIGFSIPNQKTMVYFSNETTKKSIDRTSFEKYNGSIYIEEPLTEKIATDILKKVKFFEKYVDGGNINKGDRFSEYSNDALTDMIINLSRYENTESDIQMVKDELKKRKGENIVVEEEVTYFLNKDGIKVRSKVEPKVKLSEAEWMAKHSESKEARGYAKGGAVYNKSKYLTKEQFEKWNDYVRTGKINGKKEDNMFAVARHIGTSVAKINAYEIEQRSKSNTFANGGGVGKISFEDWLKKNNIEVYKRTYYWVADDGGNDYMYSGSKGEVMKSLREDWKKSFAYGGGISKFQMLSNKVAKNYEGKRVKPQYQKEYGKVYSKSEAKEVGDKVAGKVKANQKMATGGEVKLSDLKVESGMGAGKKTWEVSYPKIQGKGVYFQDQYTKEEAKEHWLENVASKYKFATGGETKKGARGGIMTLAKKIRKDGEKWTDAVKRAGQQLK